MILVMNLYEVDRLLGGTRLGTDEESRMFINKYPEYLRDEEYQWTGWMGIVRDSDGDEREARTEMNEVWRMEPHETKIN